MIKPPKELSINIYNKVNNYLYYTKKAIYKAFPKECLLCKAKIYTSNICNYCNDYLPRLNKQCKLCNWPIVGDKINECNLCIGPNYTDNSIYGKSQWTNIQIATPYLHPIDRIIHEFKYNFDLTKGRLLAEVLLQYLLNKNVSNLPEVIIPVPLHKSKLKIRGFNQSTEIAKYLAKNLKIKLDTDLIAKYKLTSAQMGQSKLGRLSNINNSFCFNKRPKYNSVVIIDDIVTTGSTVNAIRELLYSANITNVSLWAVARSY